MLLLLVTGLGVYALRSRANPQELPLSNPLPVTDDASVVAASVRAQPSLVRVIGSHTDSLGFLVTGDGYIVTTIDALADTEGLSVAANADGHRYPARVVDYDCPTRVAVVRADGMSAARSLTMSDSLPSLGQPLALPLDGPQRGARLQVIGVGDHFQQFSPIDPERYLDVAGVITVDLTVPGVLPGTPLLSADGQVGAILLDRSADGQHTGRALPSALVRAEIDRIVQTGRLQVPSLGATWDDLAPAQAGGVHGGAQLREITPGGPADRARLRPGDVITAVDDVQIDAVHPLSYVLRNRLRAGQKVILSVRRDTRSLQATLTLASEHPPC